MLALDEICYLLLEGTPRARGQAHGEAARPLIAQGMARWKDSIDRTTGLDPDEYLARFIDHTDFLPAIERWTPDLLEEVRGIGEGSGTSFRDIYAYQLMDEEWLFRTQYRRARTTISHEHCSMIGARGTGERPTLLAQNMDLPKSYDGTQTLLHIKDQDRALESLIFTPAGLIGTTGLNNQGHGICVNTLAQLGHARQGLPVAFVMRRMLAAASVDAALDIARTVEHASGQNYAIGSPERLADVECSAHDIVSFMPDAARIYHTNHPLTNRDLHPQTIASNSGNAREASTQPAALSNSEQRFAYLERVVGGTSDSMSVDEAKAILSTCDVPISVARDSAGDSMTLGSLIMELSMPPVLHIAAGPPAESSYARWTF